MPSGHDDGGDADTTSGSSNRARRQRKRKAAINSKTGGGRGVALPVGGQGEDRLVSTLVPVFVAMMMNEPFNCFCLLLWSTNHQQSKLSEQRVPSWIKIAELR